MCNQFTVLLRIVINNKEVAMKTKQEMEKEVGCLTWLMKKLDEPCCFDGDKDKLCSASKDKVKQEAVAPDRQEMMDVFEIQMCNVPLIDHDKAIKQYKEPRPKPYYRW